MDEPTLQMLQDLINLVGHLRASLTGQTEQYERDKLREAADALRSARSALAPKVAALMAAKLRDNR